MDETRNSSAGARRPGLRRNGVTRNGVGSAPARWTGGARSSVRSAVRDGLRAGGHHRPGRAPVVLAVLVGAAFPGAIDSHTCCVPPWRA
jgi:hypothetical protein